jgi:hypothetical protein
VASDQNKKDPSHSSSDSPSEHTLALHEALLQRSAVLEATRHPKRLGLQYLNVLSKSLAILPEKFISSTPHHRILKICRAIGYTLLSQETVAMRILRFGEKTAATLIILYKPADDYELCSVRHIVTACMSLCPKACLKENSYLSYTYVNGRTIHYLELQNLSHSCPSRLKRKLCQILPKYTEKLQPVCKLPINEDDNLRNILLLKKHLKTANTIPQMVVQFHGQRNQYIESLVTLVRNSNTSFSDVFVPNKEIQLIQDIDIGAFRSDKKVEALTLIVSCPKKECCNADCSIDYMKARNWTVSIIEVTFGPVRDLNGGLFLQQRDFLHRIEQQHIAPSELWIIPLIKELYASLIPSIMKNLLTVEQCLIGSRLVVKLQREKASYVVYKEEFCTYVAIQQTGQISFTTILHAGRKSELKTHELGVCQTSMYNCTAFLVFIYTPNIDAKKKCLRLLKALTDSQ